MVMVIFYKWNISVFTMRNKAFKRCRWQLNRVDPDQSAPLSCLLFVFFWGGGFFCLLLNSLTTKKQTTKFSYANFQKM